MRLDAKIVMRMLNRMRGRPPKPAAERRTASMKIPLTAAEKRMLESAARSDEAKPVTWARDLLLKAAQRRTR